MKVGKLLIVIALAVWCGCTNKNQTAETIVINLETATENINWAAVLDTTYFKAIALETTDDCLIGEVLKIIYEDDMLIVADNMSHSVFFFNTEGKFLNSICKIGRGPDEYFELTDISVRDGKVWLLDNISCKVLCYDYTGKMLHKFETQGGVSIQALKHSILIGDVWGGVAAGGPYLLSEFDFEGNQLGRAFEYSERDENRDSGDWQPFAGADDRGSDFLLVPKNEVWHYEKGKEYLKYKFDLGEYDMPDKYKIEGVEYILKNRLHKQYGLGVTNLWESNKYRFADIHIQGDKYLCILDKKNNDIISFSKSKYLNVFDVSPGTIIRTDGDYLLSYHSGITLYQLREYIWKVNPENIKGKEIDLYNISQGLSADDNGVVLMMKFK